MYNVALSRYTVTAAEKEKFYPNFFSRKPPTKFSYLSVGATGSGIKNASREHVDVAQHVNVCVGFVPAGLTYHSPPPSRLLFHESILSSSSSSCYWYQLPAPSPSPNSPPLVVAGALLLFDPN